jgi:hypothetical protein
MKKDSMIRCKTQTNLRTWSKPATRPWQRTQTQRCGLQKRKYAKAKWYERGVPIFRQEGNYRFGGDVTQNDPASNQHDSNPAITAPLLLWLSTMHCTIDLTMRAFPFLWIEDTNKNKKEHNLENCRWLIKHSSWGLTNRSIDELFLTE